MNQVANYVPRETMYVPEKGLASLLMAEENSEGLLGLQQVADKLAEFGRNEDTYIVHAAEGETVIPSQVFTSNPHLKESLFRQMRQMGLDPDSYIIGNELNSINPVTGRPEFFFKKIFKGLKKVVKTVAPIVLPLALSMVPALGPVFGSALGSGVASLIAGGDTGDALKAALIGGGIGGLYTGLRGGFAAGQGNFMKGFSSNVGQALSAPYTAFQSAYPPALETPTTTTLETRPSLETTPSVSGSRTMSPAEIEKARLANPSMTDPNVAAVPKVELQDVTPPATVGKIPITELPFIKPLSDTATLANVDPKLDPRFGGDVSWGAAEAPPGSDRNILQKSRDWMIRGGKSPEDVSLLKQAAADKAYDRRYNQVIGRGASDAVAERAATYAADMAEQQAGPGMLTRYGPSLAIGSGILGAAGAFDEPEPPEEVDFFETRYGPEGTIAQRLPQLRFADPAPYTPVGLQDVRVPSRFAAKGGQIDQQYFPPRIGAISGPGTGISDDVPAMLSDGEFVMTADAVRGAGNGDRDRGMRNMYNMMRRFEGGAVA